MRIILVVGDITEFSEDAIVNSANTLGVMGSGVALAIKKKGGDIIEKEAREKAPIPIGKAILTTAGRLKCKFVIHAPTVEKPGDFSSPGYVYEAVKAVVSVAKENAFKSIALPLMGAGAGGLVPELSLRSIFTALLEGKDLELDAYTYLRTQELLEIARRVLREYKLVEVGENTWTCR